MNHCGLLLTAILTAAVVAQQALGQVNRKHTETLLGPFPAEVRDSALIGPDGRRIVWIQKTASAQAVVLDGRRQESFERVTALTFSPDGRRFAYAASKDGKWYVKRDGATDGPFERVGPPVFNVDGSTLAHVAMTADGNRVVVTNGVPGQPYEMISAGLIEFSPDGRRTAYGGVRQGQCYLVVDGRELGPYQDLGTRTGYRFSPDGSRLAFVAMFDNKLSVVVDGERGPGCHDVGQVVFSPDGTRLAHAMQESAGGPWRVVVDEQPQAAYDTLGDGSLEFSPDGSRLVHAGRSGGKWCLVVDGTEGRKCDGIAEIKFSDGGESLAYVAQSEQTETVVLDGRPQRTFDNIGGGSLVFSPGGRKLAYEARSGWARFVVVDGKRKGRYAMVGYLTFSPDGRHYAYAATQEDEAFTVVDDQEAAHRYDAIWNAGGEKLRFDHRKKFHYMAIKEGNILLVEEEVD